MKALFAMALTRAHGGTGARRLPLPAAPEKLRTAPPRPSRKWSGTESGQAYDKAINDYVSCIDHELDAAITKGATSSSAAETDMQHVEAQKHNAAIDQLQSIATASTSK